jgi:predicted SAM-dependent methyltransferase
MRNTVFWVWLIRIRATYRAWLGKFRSHKKIREWLRNTDIKAVQVGAGANSLTGWLNTDLFPRPGQVYLNAQKKLPFPDDSIDYLFCEHIIEHLSWADFPRFIRECYRVMKKGATIRLVTPDLDSFIQMISTPDSDNAQQYIQDYLEINQNRMSKIFYGNANLVVDPVFVMNSIFYDHGHRLIVNEVYLTKLLANSGFAEIRKVQVGHSEVSILCGIEGHGKTIGDMMNRIESLVLEAVKIK